MSYRGARAGDRGQNIRLYIIKTSVANNFVNSSVRPNKTKNLFPVTWPKK